MRIRNLHVNGFGVLHDRTLSFDGPLTVIYGPNEAGKSTLMSFVQAVLFGFPSRASRTESRIEPQGGGAQGGYLTLVSDQGEVMRIERRDGGAGAGRGRAPGTGRVTVTLADGTQGGGELLQPLLGGITGELFRSLFAFSLSELQELRSLQSDELSGYLYSAGLGNRASVIMAAERKLTLEMEQLYRPRGKNQAINQALKALEELEADLRRSKEHVGHYNDIAAELDKLEQRIQYTDAKLKEIRINKAFLDAAEQARSYWFRRNKVNNELALLPVFADFPQDALIRFELLLQEKERLLVDLGRRRHQLAQLQLTFDSMSPDLSPLLHRTELDSLCERVGEYRDAKIRIAELRVVLEQQQLQMDKLLTQMGDHWTENTLEQQQITFIRREQLRFFRERETELGRNKERYVAELETLQKQEKSASEEVKERERERNLLLQQLELRFHGEEQSRVETLTDRLQQLQKEQQQLSQLNLEMRHVRQREVDDSRHFAADPSVPDRQLRPTFVILFVIIILFPASFWLFGHKWAAFSSLLLVSAAIGYLFIQQRKAPSTTRRVPQTQQQYTFGEQKQELEQQIQMLEQRLSSSIRQFTGIPEIAAAAERQFGLSPLTVNQTHSNAQNDEWLDLLRKAADEWRAAQGELLRKEEQLQEALKISASGLKQRQSAENRLAHHQEEQNQHEIAWQDWLAQQRFPYPLSADIVLELFQLIEQGQQQLQLKHSNEVKLHLIHEQMETFEQRACLLLDLPNTSTDLILALKQWQETCKRITTQIQQREELEQKLVRDFEVQREVEDAYARIEERIHSLWKEAGAYDEEQFRLHARQLADRLIKLGELKQLESLLEEGNNTTRMNELDKLLTDKSSFELQEDIRELEMQFNQMEQEADEMRDHRGRLRNELEKLEQGAEHADKLYRMEEQKAVLVEHTKRWATLSLCSALFQKARDTYERERQPGVLLQASNYFSVITKGRFTRIVVPLSEKRLIAERADGQMVDSSVLSRGTAEQLYLAMRFALADEYARKASLPIIMDDVFVNFDHERLTNSIQVLKKVSEKHQILLFTCHPHVLEAVTALEPTCQVINLEL